MQEDKQPKRPNRTTIEIPPQLRQRLKALAEKTGRKQAALMIQALQEFLDRQKE